MKKIFTPIIILICLIFFSSNNVLVYANELSDNISDQLQNLDLSELENIVISKRQEEINKRFISLMGYKEELYLKYKDEIDNLAVKFERLSKLTFANYELFDITTCESKKCYLFDFSRLYFFVFKADFRVHCSHYKTLFTQFG